MAMMQNSLRFPTNQQHLMPMQFNEPINQGMMSQPSGLAGDAAAGMNVNFLHPNAIPPPPDGQSKSLQPVGAPPPGTIALSTLIDFVVYKTYHDITVMAEILPSKSDMEKKITIVDFATRTRQLFVRLLSLVKWASSVGKVVRCSESSAFLDRQAMLFIDTADKLHLLANQLVVQARLPNFSIPAAVDVLTTGTYPRLPLCIRDRIIPPDPILPKEKKATLKRIDQIMLYRLVTEVIPPQVTEVKVERGVVHLHVPNEFKAYLTLMGDGGETPWRVLKLEFLVEDLDVGTGRSLVHSLQVNYIHELVQSRLISCDKPLVDLYNLLHSFCLSLQLEVLHAQADRLLKLRWGKFIQIDEYLPGQKLSISYWRLSAYKPQPTPMVVAVRQSPTDASKPLQVLHNPKLSLDDVSLVESCSHIRDLSLECLIHRSIAARSFHLLVDIKQMLHKHIRHDTSHFLDEEDDKHSVLYIPLLDPPHESECLRIFVDPQTGCLVPSLDGISVSILEKMEKEINESHSSLLSWVVTLRDQLAQRRCKIAVQHLSVICLEQLQISKETPYSFGNNCLFIKIIHSPSYFLVVEMTSNPDWPTSISHKYFLLATSKSSSAQKEELLITSVEEMHVGLTSYDEKPKKFDLESGFSAMKIEGDGNETELLHMISVCNAHLPFIPLIGGAVRGGA